MPSAPSADFRARARAEAERYGPDPWVFVRELLQNARDAGATRVDFTTEHRGGRWLLRCRDDGEGMSFAHARRYLFSLYASSKEQRRDQVGRFGVGFWSILRFEPERIVIRSRTRAERPHAADPEDRGGAWELELTGDLESAIRRTPELEPGTEVELERPAVDAELERRVHDAAFQNARFLATRDDPERPLVIAVNGRRVNASFALPAPSASFRRGRVRGVVGLGGAARVELFSRGLRVRSAASLADFVAAGGRSTDRSRVQFTELPGRLAPQALLESDALELMLSRSDARDNKALRRLVQLAQRELERLITRQLDAARPRPWWRRAWEALSGALRRSLAARVVAAALVGAAVAFAAAWALWGDRILERFRGADDPIFGTGTFGQHETGSAELPARYADLAGMYRGPQVDVLAGAITREPPLSYRPPEARLYFAALLFDRLGDAEQAGPPELAGDYPFATCEEGAVCPEVELRLDAPAGLMRVPVPTGHRMLAGGATLDGEAVRVQSGALGEPVLALATDARGVLRYRTAPATPARKSAAPRSSGLLPPELRETAAALRRLPAAERVARLTALTQDLVAYSTEREVAEASRALQAEGLGFIDRALQLGQGDCDVQNGLLVALLHEAAVPARLAIGFVGQDGRAHPWLHAWVEYRLGGGGWQIADASVGAAPAGVAVGTGPQEPVPSDLPPEATSTNPAARPQDPLGPATPPLDRPPALAVPEPAAPVAGDERAAPQFAPTRPRPVLGYALAALSVLLAGASALAFARGRIRRELALDASGDLSRLLQGALQQPEVFQAVPAVFERPLVPSASGRALSLATARTLATRGRLFRTRARSPLAADAVAGGAVVLDDRSPEARAVADALGATDLDRWDAMLAQTSSSALLEVVTARLREAGEPWVALVSPVLGSEEVRSLDLTPLRLRRSPLRGRRVVLVGPANPWLLDAAAALQSRPHAAVFAALDYLLDRLDLGAERTAAMLQASARAAVHEGAGGAPS